MYRRVLTFQSSYLRACLLISFESSPWLFVSSFDGHIYLILLGTYTFSPYIPIFRIQFSSFSVFKVRFKILYSNRTFFVLKFDLKLSLKIVFLEPYFSIFKRFFRACQISFFYFQSSVWNMYLKPNNFFFDICFKNGFLWALFFII